ncbi:MAG: cytochrome c biogenesis protein CcdA [Rhodospirillales bacterium]|nr:cytochrome c biogenesis protein CcdA [Rhodospirillales bacterium]
MSAAVGSLAFGYLAGGLSTLSPCVLPLLPLLLVGAFDEHRLGPLALAGGLAVSFTLLGLGLATVGLAVGLDSGPVRLAAALLMIAFGAILIAPRLQLAFAGWVAPLSGGANGMLERLTPKGLSGQFLLGLVLGAVWAPCTGPTLGAAVGLAAQGQTLIYAASVMAVFSLGAATPVLALAYGSRQAMRQRRDRLAQFAKKAKPTMGAMLLLIGVLVAAGWDKVLETQLVAIMPAWLVDLTTRF